MMRWATVLLAAFSVFAAAQEDTDSPLAPEFRERLIGSLEKQATVFDEAIRQSPKDAALYSRRGDANLFLGRFQKAVGDFEKMIQLDPSQDAPHWRLGIAYYFAGEHAKSARQFEKYHAHDGRDRENGIWKFLAQAKVDGVETARREMIEYKEFDREPFPLLYEMFAGKKTGEEVLADLQERDLTRDERVLFFAHYYVGLNEAVLGRKDKARELVAKAVANQWGQTAERGPAYMWHVARLHHEQLSRDE